VVLACKQTVKVTQKPSTPNCSHYQCPVINVYPERNEESMRTRRLPPFQLTPGHRHQHTQSPGTWRCNEILPTAQSHRRICVGHNCSGLSLISDISRTPQSDMTTPSRETTEMYMHAGRKLISSFECILARFCRYCWEYRPGYWRSGEGEKQTWKRGWRERVREREID